jgi:hypothetical protein
LHVFDFWNKEYLGAWEAGIALDVSPTSCRVLTVLPSNGRIRLISTNRHVTQGWVDLVEMKYDDDAKTSSGRSRVIKNDPYELYFVFPRDNNFKVKSAAAQSGNGLLPVTVANHQGWATVRIASAQTAEVTWEVRFEPADIYHYPPGDPENLRIERVDLDGINLSWKEQYFLNVGYQVYLDGRLQGYTPKAALVLRGLDPKVEHTVAVETVWEDGSTSRGKAERSFTIRSMVPKEMPLSRLKLLSTGGPWSRVINGPVAIGEKSYQDGIILRPGLEATYEIEGLYNTLTALVGVGDESNVDSGIEFVLVWDGKELWRSSSLRRGEGAKPVEVDIAGVQSLVLRAEGMGAGRRSRIQAAWVEPTLKQ